MPSCITSLNGFTRPLGNSDSDGLPHYGDNHSRAPALVQSSTAGEPLENAYPLGKRKIETSTEECVLISEISPTPASLPISSVGKLELAMDVELAMYAYYHRIENVQNTVRLVADKHKIEYEHYLDWQPASELAQDIGNELGLCTDSSSKGLIYSRQSGVTAFLLQNESLNQVRLVFGGSSSGVYPGDPLVRHLRNPEMSCKHWVSNFNNAVCGRIPASYKDAGKILEKLKCKVEEKGQLSDEGAGKTMEVIVSGHSKGSGEAACASLSQTEPVKTICFSSAEFGVGIQNYIPQENRMRAGQYVTHFNLPDDPVPNMKKVLRRPLTLYGNVIIVPPIKTGRFVNKSYHQHAFTGDHVVSYACQVGERAP